MSTLKPLDDEVVLERLEADPRSVGGIVIPDDRREGGAVLFGRYADREVGLGGKVHLIANETGLLAVLGT